MQKQKIGGLCLLQVILCVFVVLIHTRPFINYPFINSITSNGIFRIAVPLFFVMNGYFFSFDKEQFISKLKKLFVIYTFLLMLFSPLWLDLSSPYGIMKTLTYNIVIGWHHLWYLSSLIVASVIIYIMRNKTGLLLIISTILFILSYFIQNSYLLLDGYIFEKLNSKLYLYRNALTFAVPFMLIGIYIRKNENLKVSLPLLAISIVALLTEVIIFALAETKDNMARDLYVTLMFTAPVLFIFFKNMALSFEEKVSGRVYFYHPICEMMFKFAGYTGGLVISTATLAFAFTFAIVIEKMKEKNMF